ncbi:MAG: anthranilate phosphoribosyltransferase [Anaerolineaceae bacterium]|nr:anthranilate phosphoribosyltransferase [Anaerolineaceae bacterium]
MLEAIRKLSRHEDLTVEESRAAMTEIMEGRASPVQMAAYLTALAMKGPTSDEITGAALVMREKATGIDPGGRTVVDTCGTGGDHSGTFNISTAAALVTAGAGLAVAKHGNRSNTGKSGSSDVLEVLGVNLNVSPEVVSRCIREAGIGFLFAPLLHGAMKHAVGVRKELGIRTIFNLLGPLTNPAGARRQVMGVFDVHLVGLIAQVLQNLGAEHALVVHGTDGLDEITLSGPTRVAEVTPEEIKLYELAPEQFGLQTNDMKHLVVDSAEASAKVIRGVLAGRKGPARDIVVLNSAAAIYVGGAAESIQAALPLAAESIDSGAAAKTLARLVDLTGAA